MREADLERLLHEGRRYRRTTAFFGEGSLFFFSRLLHEGRPYPRPSAFFWEGSLFFSAAHFFFQPHTAEVTIAPATIGLLMRFSFSIAVGHCGPMGSD